MNGAGGNITIIGGTSAGTGQGGNITIHAAEPAEPAEPCIVDELRKLAQPGPVTNPYRVRELRRRNGWSQ